MGKICEVDLKDIKQLKEKLEQYNKFDKKLLMKETVQEIAEELLDTVVAKTPRDTGRLQESWKMTDVVDHGSYVEITVYNPVDYASHVEYDHKQEVGRYVPQIGKRLVKPLVEGKFFLKKSVEIVDDEAPNIIKRKLIKALEDLLNVK